MSWLVAAIPYIVAVIFFLVGAICVGLVVVQLPGAWIMIGVALVIELADALYLPADDRMTFNWWLLGGCVALAALGELMEFIATILGAKRAGSSNRGTIGSIIGAICGAILATPLLPPFGMLIGAIVGTFIGAILGELTVERSTVRGSIRPATGATIGRILGTVSKLPIAVAVWVVLTIAAFWV